MDIDRAARTDNADNPTYVENVDAADDAPRRRPGCGCWIALLVVLLLGGGAGGFLMGTIITREETPLPGEEFMTDLALRQIAVPAEYQDMRMPGNVDVNKGKELFDVQCSFCHGQGGDGSAQLGATMYPRAAILRSDRTQTKTDGQLFWLISHGINLTGMPGFSEKFGTDQVKGPNTDEEIWNMVAYIRTLKGGAK